MYYAIYNHNQDKFLIADFRSLLDEEGLDSVWFSETLWGESGDEIGLINLEAFDNLKEAQEAKKELEKLSWDKLEILAIRQAWVFNIDHGVKVPQE